MESTSNKVQQEPGADNPRQREPSPERLVQLGLGFWASKTLLSAVELGVFSCLATGPRDAAELTEALGLHPRSALDFLSRRKALRNPGQNHGSQCFSVGFVSCYHASRS